MPRHETISAAEAARRLGISLDTLRRWDRAGKIEVTRDSANRRRVDTSEIERLAGMKPPAALGPQPLRRRHLDVEVEGLLAQVEIEVSGPVRIVAWSRETPSRPSGLLRARRRRASSSRPRCWSNDEAPLRARGGIAARRLPADRPPAALSVRGVRSARIPDHAGRTGRRVRGGVAEVPGRSSTPRVCARSRRCSRRTPSS